MAIFRAKNTLLRDKYMEFGDGDSIKLLFRISRLLYGILSGASSGKKVFV